MPSYVSFDGTTIHYERFGNGDPVICLHSFPFDSRVWSSTGVVDALVSAGRSVIAPDRRGSGQSDRPRDPLRYADNACSKDVSSLIDDLGLDVVDLAAFSFGSFVGLRVIQTEPRVRRAVLGGIGDSVFELVSERRGRFVTMLEADDVATLPEPGRITRERIENLGADRLALAALWSVPFVEFDRSFDNVVADVLVITGEDDEGAGDPAALVARLPRASLLRPPTTHAATMNHHMFKEHLIGHVNAEPD